MRLKFSVDGSGLTLRLRGQELDLDLETDNERQEIRHKLDQLL